MSETQIVQAVLLRVGSMPNVRLWRSNTGAAKIGDAWVRFGLKGSADCTGILADGRRLEIECKTLTGRQSDDQRSFQRMIERFGGVYLLVRSADDAEEQVRETLTRKPAPRMPAAENPTDT